MCLAVPGRIVSKYRDTVTVDYGNQKRTVRVLERCCVGDYVIVQAGFVVQKVQKKEALQSLRAWKTVT